MNVEELLGRAAKTHHMVWMKQDGEDADWPMWYASWLIDHSNFLEMIDQPLTKSQLTCKLMTLDQEYTAANDSSQTWQAYYADSLTGTKE